MCIDKPFEGCYNKSVDSLYDFVSIISFLYGFVPIFSKFIDKIKIWWYNLLCIMMSYVVNWIFVRSLVPLYADQGEVRCKSVATIITVIECPAFLKCHAFLSRNTHQASMRRYVQSQRGCTNVFGYEKRSRFCRRYSITMPIFWQDCYAFTVFAVKAFLLSRRSYVG